MSGLLSNLIVCGRCYGLGAIETTQSIGVPPACDECGGRGYVTADHARHSDGNRAICLPVTVSEETVERSRR